jgi:hypothetical protein
MKLFSSRFLLSLPFCLLLSCKSSTSSLELGKDSEGVQYSRFDPWLDQLDEALNPKGNVSFDAIAKELVDGSSRVAAFNLQALARLYESEDKMFKTIKEDFKGLEDAIGAYDKWSNVIKKAKKKGLSGDKLNDLMARQNSEMDKLKEFLEKEKWVTGGKKKSRLKEIKSELKDFKWLSPEDDRKLLIDVVAKELKSLDETKFDMGILEEGDGVHELRRSLRWILIEMRVLNGLFAFNNRNKCAIPQYSSLLNQEVSSSNYATLPPPSTEVESCKIDQCLFLGIVDLVKQIGDQKDTAEAELNESGSKHPSDEVPQSIRKVLEPMYMNMKSSNLVATLRNQLKSCN